jgi:hypothetical protein
VPSTRAREALPFDCGGSAAWVTLQGSMHVVGVFLGVFQKNEFGIFRKNKALSVTFDGLREKQFIFN